MRIMLASHNQALRRMRPVGESKQPARYPRMSTDRTHSHSTNHMWPGWHAFSKRKDGIQQRYGLIRKAVIRPGGRLILLSIWLISGPMFIIGVWKTCQALTKLRTLLWTR